MSEVMPNESLSPSPRIHEEPDGFWEDVTANSVSEFIQLVFEQQIPFISIEPDSGFLYRGQSSILWDPIPKLYRTRLQTARHYSDLEFGLLHRFSLMSVPYKNWNTPLDWHADWLSLFVGQHYGLATRLLDWTSNPLAALWFATDVATAGGETDGVVYCLDLGEAGGLSLTDLSTSPLESTDLIILHPPDDTTRIYSQDAYFTSHPCNVSSGHPLQIEELNNTGDYSRRIVIDRGAFRSIRLDLNRLSVNSAKLFQDLIGVCEHINWLETESR